MDCVCMFTHVSTGARGGGGGVEVCLEHLSRSFLILYIEAVSLFKNKLSDSASLAGQLALGTPSPLSEC